MKLGSRKYQDDHFQRVASLYYEAMDTEQRPRAVVAGLFDTSTDTAGRWIREARKRGFIEVEADLYAEQFPNTNVIRVARVLGVPPKELASAVLAEANGLLSVEEGRWS